MSEIINIQSTDEIFVLDSGDCVITYEEPQGITVEIVNEIVEINLVSETISIDPIEDSFEIVETPEVFDFSDNDSTYVENNLLRYIDIPAGEDLIAYEPVYLKDGQWLKASSQIDYPGSTYGIVLESVASGLPVKVHIYGRIKNDTWSFNVNSSVYLGVNSLSQSLLGNELINIVMGNVISPTELHFSPFELPESRQMVPVTLTDFVSDTLIYQGYATPGSQTSDPVWRVKRIQISAVDGDVTESFADGDSSYDNIWDDRVSLTYLP